MTGCLPLIVAAVSAVSAELQTNMCPIWTTADLRDFRNGDYPALRVLDLVGQVTCLGTREQTGFRTLVVEDRTGRAELVYYGDDISLGDIVHFQGISRLSGRLWPWDQPDKVTILGKKALPPPLATGISKLDAQRDDLKLVSTEGLVVSSFDDEIDARFRVLIVRDGRTIMPVYALQSQIAESRPETGARIRVFGVFHRSINSYRLFQQPTIVSDRIEVLSPPPADPFDVPALRYRARISANEIAELGRRKITGLVLAVWDGCRLMLKTDRNDICFARFQPEHPLPATGETVTIVGEIDSDFFNITFKDARWKPAASVAVEPDEPPTDISPRDIFRKTPTGRDNIDITRQGALVRLSGTLLLLPAPGHDNRRLTVSCDGYTVSVDVSALSEVPPDLAVGAELRITGRCLLESMRTANYDVFPRITNFTVVTRTPSDIEIISRPPWWTPSRLLGVIAALFAVLIGFAIWNRVLNRLVQRRSRELAKAEIAQASSELRVAERTRLAMELHDSLSQNLTGIALAIGAGEYAMAERSLKSCRRELKNCLWDLRSDALETSDMGEAIRRTLAPNLKDTKLTVRFRLARNTLSDNTAYAILRIVRELAVNAKRHGNATEVRVAGSVEEHRILFSVRDNGKGFDPENIPGIDEGHFGLQGIRERIKHLNGEMKIESSPTTGTKVSIWLKKPQC